MVRVHSGLPLHSVYPLCQRYECECYASTVTAMGYPCAVMWVGA